MPRGPRIIRKYENRRLYDTSASKYVNLEQVAELVRSGEEVQVVEAKSGDDVTRQVLTQIIVDGSKEGGGGPPVEFLEDLVRARDRVQRDFLQWYLRGASEVYSHLRESWERSQRQRSAARFPDVARFLDPTGLARAWGAAGFARVFGSEEPSRGRADDARPRDDEELEDEGFLEEEGEDEDGVEEEASAEEEIAALRAQLERLERRVGRGRA